MTLIDRYIARAVGLNVVMVLVVLSGLLLFFGFIDEADDLGTGTYSALDAFIFVLLQMPQRIYEVFPLALLLGALLGLGLLANNSELSVMRAAGVSVRRIVWAVMKAGAVLLLLAILVGEVVSPRAVQYSHNLRSLAKEGMVRLSSDYAFWLRDGEYFINIYRVLPEGQLGDVYAYQFDHQQRLLSMAHARTAAYQNRRWLLSGVEQTLMLPDGSTSTHYYEQLEWDSSLSPELLSILVLDPHDLSGRDLYAYVKHLRQNNQRSAPYELELWAKLLYPLLSATMILLAIPFVFGPLRTVSLSQRILMGTLMGVGFYVVNEMVTRASLLYGLNPLLSALLPMLLFLLLGLLLLRRVV